VPLGLGELPQLADGQQLAHARRRGGEQAEHAAALEDVDERAGRKLVAQVLLERVLRVDRDVKQAARKLHLMKRLRALAIEAAGHVAAAGDLGDDRALARTRCHQPERRRDRRLADAALARDDEQPLGEQVAVHGRAHYPRSLLRGVKESPARLRIERRVRFP